MKQKICPQCGEPVPDEGATICMVCGHSLKRRYTMRKELVIGGAVLVVVCLVGYFVVFPALFGPTIITSTDNVGFTVTLEDGTASVLYAGTADGSAVTDLRIILLAEGGRSTQLVSVQNPQPGAVFGPVSVNTGGNPVAVYYSANDADGTEISNTIRI